ncbi:MAG: cation:proton antiporter [Candidatus Odinarchaeia archaeon]
MADLILTILNLGIVLFAAKMLGEVFKRIRQPELIGEILVGIILGPYALGIVAFSEPLEFISELGAIMLLFVVGLETDVGRIIKSGAPAIAIAINGMIVPVVMGFLYGYFMSASLSFALYIGATLAATSVGITVRILLDLGKYQIKEAQALITAAVFDDIMSLILLSIVSSLSITGEISLGLLLELTTGIVIFFLAMAALSIILSRHFIPIVNKMKSRGALIVLAFSLALIVSYLAHYFGLALIIGAYVAGLLISEESTRVHILKGLSSVAHITVPVFFVYIGMQIPLNMLPQGVVFGIPLSIIAIVSKYIGASTGAKIGGFKGKSLHIIGIGCIPRGEVGLIFAKIGLSLGILDAVWFSSVVIMVLITTFMAPPILKQLLKEEKLNEDKLKTESATSNSNVINNKKERESI